MFKTLLARQGLSYDRLYTLLAVAEAGSIARAAGGDPVRQSQYSRQLKELGGFAGAELVRRRGRTIALTEAGRELARLARAHLAGLADYVESQRSGPLEIALAANDNLLQWLVAPRLGRLRERMPGIRVTLHNVRTADLVPGLLDLRFDVGVGRPVAGHEGLQSKRLGIMRYVLIAPQNMVAAASAQADEKHWAQLPFAVLAGDSDLGRSFLALAARAWRGFQPAILCESFAQALQACRSGHFAAVAPAFALTKTAANEFVALSPAWLAKLDQPLALYWNARTADLRPRVAESIKLLSSLLML